MTQSFTAPPAALFDRGLALLRGGKAAEARTAFEQVLKLQPGNFDAMLLLGMIAGQSRDYARAADFFSRAAAINPRDPQLFNNLGFAQKEMGAFAPALASFEKAIALEPGYAKAHNNRGLALAALNRFGDAVAAYDKALEADGRYAEAWNNRGSALAGLNRLEDAIASFGNAINLNANYAEACNNRGNALADLNRPADALASYARALAIRPEYADAWCNRGSALADMDQFADAVAAFDRALGLDPRHAQAWCNRGVALSELKQPEAALASFEKAIALGPDYVLALQNKGLCLLAMGRFAEGWPLFEWRDKEPAMAGKAFPAKPLWLGDAPLRGKTILVHFERGLGDTIQFSRYLPLLAREGATLLFAPQNPLKALLAGLGDAALVDADGPMPHIDFQVPLMSLPLAFRGRDIPAPVSYLAAEPERARRWKARLGPEGFKIGICWQGALRRNDKGRSFPAAQFQALSQIPGVRLIGLHKGAGEAQLAHLPPGMAVETPGADFDSGPDAFLDTAAVMTACDLVVTSDTAIAHLAGALGVPVWLVLKHVPDWRWLLEGETSPWYPTMRLFRQPAAGDWDGAFAAVAAAVRREMETA